MTTKHEYGDSFTGMLCGAMVAQPDGSGDECGLPFDADAHNGSDGAEDKRWIALRASAHDWPVFQRMGWDDE